MPLSLPIYRKLPTDAGAIVIQALQSQASGAGPHRDAEQGSSASRRESVTGQLRYFPAMEAVGSEKPRRERHLVSPLAYFKCILRREIEQKVFLLCKAVLANCMNKNLLSRF